ncbi:MAG: hypothetical protein SFX18_07960 [Pirellulales bacterium]|nr:hypothetical protein [Pirellulales bacterium]
MSAADEQPPNQPQILLWPEIPDPPPQREFGQRLRQRLNRALVTEQMIDGVLCGLGGAVWELTTALAAGALLPQWPAPSRPPAKNQQSTI